MSSSVRVKVTLDHEGPFSNLMYVTGAVNMKVLKDISIENVQIKLEGISQTKVTREYFTKNGKRRREILNETHELLYDVSTLFPPDNVKNISNSNNFTLVPGDYDYNFAFQLPLWAQCSNPHSFEGSNFLQSSEERTRYNSHTSRTNGTKLSHKLNPLPPSMSVSYDDTNCGASIKYFLKVTVRRASKFSLNTREVIPLRFRVFDAEQKSYKYKQIVPHWIPSSDNLIITTTENTGSAPPMAQRKKSFLSRAFDSSPIIRSNTFDIPVESYGYVLTPYALSGGQVSLALSLMTKLKPSLFKNRNNGSSNGTGQIYIERLSVSLHSVTRLTAEGFTDHKTLVATLLDLQKVAVVDFANGEESGLKSEDDLNLYKVDIPADLIKNIKLPRNLVQTFETCNISRYYGLLVEILFTGSPNSPVNRKPVSFRLPLEILSNVPQPEILNSDRPSTNEEHDYTQPPPLESKADEAYQEQINNNNGNSSHEVEEQLPSYSESTNY